MRTTEGDAAAGQVAAAADDGGERIIAGDERGSRGAPAVVLPPRWGLMDRARLLQRHGAGEDGGRQVVLLIREKIEFIQALAEFLHAAHRHTLERGILHRREQHHALKLMQSQRIAEQAGHGQAALGVDFVRMCGEKQGHKGARDSVGRKWLIMG